MGDDRTCCFFVTVPLRPFKHQCGRVAIRVDFQFQLRNARPRQMERDEAGFRFRQVPVTGRRHVVDAKSAQRPVRLPDVRQVERAPFEPQFRHRSQARSVGGSAQHRNAAPFAELGVGLLPHLPFALLSAFSCATTRCDNQTPPCSTRPATLWHPSLGQNMNRLTPAQTETVTALEYFGVAPAPDSVCGSGNGITFSLADREEALAVLRNRARFAQGPLGILHGRAVGGLVTEYRSYRRDNLRSLHVVLGKGGVFADLDRFNPYQNPLDLLRHGFLELMPHLLRLAFGRGPVGEVD